MSQKVDFKPRYTNWIKEGIFMIIMRCTLNKDIWQQNSRKVTEHKFQTYLTEKRRNRQNHNQNGGLLPDLFQKHADQTYKKTEKNSVDAQQHSQHV